MSRGNFALFACLTAVAICGSASAAQPYPSKPIRLVLNVGTGGVGDVTNRIFATHMSKSLGQQIVVDNRPSAGGVAAAESREGTGDGFFATLRMTIPTVGGRPR